MTVDKSILQGATPLHRKTCRRCNDLGHAHSLTFSCFQRQPFLNRDRTRKWMLAAIGHARERHGFHLWAYVIMPEHVHILLYPPEEYDISSILSSLKQPVSKRAILYVRQNAPEFLEHMTDRQPNGKTSVRFWQRGGGFDRNLWSPELIWKTIDYLHANPIRRRLCDTDSDWRWSSARAYHGLDSDGPPIDFESLPDDPRPSQGRRSH